MTSAIPVVLVENGLASNEVDDVSTLLDVRGASIEVIGHVGDIKVGLCPGLGQVLLVLGCLCHGFSIVQCDRFLSVNWSGVLK